MKGFKVTSPDNRDTVSTANHGTYYVQKKRIIREFRFGYYGHKTGAEAHAAMLKFLETRKDAAELFVNLLEFGK